MGYVGLPLAVAFAAEGHDVVAIDIDRRKVDALQAGRSYIEDVDHDAVVAQVPLALDLRGVTRRSGGRAVLL